MQKNEKRECFIVIILIIRRHSLGTLNTMSQILVFFLLCDEAGYIWMTFSLVIKKDQFVIRAIDITTPI